MFTRNNGGCVKLALSLAAKSKLVLSLLAVAFLFSPLASAQGGGIGGYDLKSTADLVFPFDYNGTGITDHLVLYRPGTGTIWILSNNSGSYTPVFQSGSGIGGFDLMSPADRIFAFDYNGSGFKDHLVCYRPGTGIIFVLANNGGTFTPVYASGDGIGGYDLMSTADRAFAFDYDGSGLSDHLVMYRPGTGTIAILQNINGTFSPVYDGGDGIGGFDLMSTSDRMLAFDYYGLGHSDHIVAYRPGTGVVFILGNNNGSFSPVYAASDGIGGYDLMSSADVLVAYDYLGTGSQDHLIAYRPGTGTIWILGSSYFQYAPVYQSTGIAGFDLLSTADRIVPVDYTAVSANDTGLFSQLLLYRPGTGVAWILNNSSGSFSPVFQDAASTANPSIMRTTDTVSAAP